MLTFFATDNKLVCDGGLERVYISCESSRVFLKKYDIKDL